MNNLLNPLTEQEEVEAKELSNKLFAGGKVFIIVKNEDINSPEIKRYKELMDKKMAFLYAYKRIQKQMMWN